MTTIAMDFRGACVDACGNAVEGSVESIMTLNKIGAKVIVRNGDCIEDDLEIESWFQSHGLKIDKRCYFEKKTFLCQVHASCPIGNEEPIVDWTETMKNISEKEEIKQLVRKALL